jgi:hypothetical protein
LQQHRTGRYSGAPFCLSPDSNKVRVRLWKSELQKLANALDRVIEVRRLPPGTSKWSRIEHRLFSLISMNWRARPPIR